MRNLFEEIPLASMNTSMTINATAAWLMALYIATADEQGAPRSQLQGTTSPNSRTRSSTAIAVASA